MNWGHLVLVVAVSGVVASFTDWLFMGLLFHERYKEAPEIWRTGTSQRERIIYSELIGLITCAAFAWLLAATGRQELASGLKMSLAIWAIAVVPIIATNTLWLRMSPYIGVSHSLGWLVRLAITAVAASYLF